MHSDVSGGEKWCQRGSRALLEKSGAALQKCPSSLHVLCCTTCTLRFYREWYRTTLKWCQRARVSSDGGKVWCSFAKTRSNAPPTHYQEYAAKGCTRCSGVRKMKVVVYIVHCTIQQDGRNASSIAERQLEDKQNHPKGL